MNNENNRTLWVRRTNRHIPMFDLQILAAHKFWQREYKGLGNSSGRESNSVIANGNIDSTDVHWDGTSNSCLAYVTATGTVDEKSLKAHIGGRAATLIADDDGKLMVSGMDAGN